MKIGLNGQRILIEKPAGAELYTINLFKLLARIDKENEYIVYFDQEPDKDFFQEISNNNPNFKYKVVEKKIFWTQFDLALELIKNPVDVFFTAVHTIPMIRSSKTKFVTMIHGLEYRFTKGYKNPINRLKIERPIKYAVKHSDKIITPSIATKNEILKRGWGAKEESIDIVYEGVAEVFHRKDEKEIEEIRTKYNVGNGPYLLFVSTIQPRKNIPNMIRAFSQFLNENPEFKDLKILIAGKNGWDFEESLEAPQKYGVEENVMFLGRVPTEDLPALLSGAKAYVNFSYEEGFGLPLLESMACGTPCVVSDIPAHREIADYLGIYSNQHNVEDMKDGIFKILKGQIIDEKHKSELLERSKYFSWEKTAEKTLEIITKTFSQNN